MTKKTLTIMGMEVPVVFNMAVQIAYEQMTSKPFNLSDINTSAASMALCFASIITANPETDITFDMLINEASAKDITTLRSAVYDCISEWCEIPPTLSKEEAKGGSEKNSSAPATPTDLS